MRIAKASAYAPIYTVSSLPAEKINLVILIILTNPLLPDPPPLPAVRKAC